MMFEASTLGPARVPKVILVLLPFKASEQSFKLFDPFKLSF